MSTPRPRAVAALAVLLAAITAAPARAADIFPGRVVAKFAPGQRAAAIDRADIDVDSVKSEPYLPGTAKIDLAPGQSVADAVRELEGARGVVWAEPEVIVRTFATPNDPMFGQQWGLQNTGQTVLDPAHPASLGPDFGASGDDINATGAWDLTTGSRSVDVGIVDNGVASGHPDLAANVAASRGGNTFSGGSTEPDVPATDSFHGTHVAGIVGAVGNNGTGVAGVNWAVTMIPISALGYDNTNCGSDSCGSSVSVANGLALAAVRGARVVNASIGSSPGSLNNTDIQVETQAVTDHPNTLYVFAAGNDGNDNDTSAVYPCNINAANVICVARSQIDDSLASNSNYGATTVDLAAPGGRILSTIPDGSLYEKENGTSMASPMVAGVAALILARNPWSSVAQVKSAILSSVDVRPAFAGKTVTGGRLNARAALLASDDTAGPAAFSLNGPADGTLTAAAHQAVSWSASSDAKSGLDHYDVLVDGAVAGTTSATSTAIDIPEGTHAVSVRAVDRAGNRTATAPVSVSIDTSSPTNPGSGLPLNGAILDTARPAISWTAATDALSGLAGYDVSLDGNPATRVGASTLSFTPSQALAQGVHSWTVKSVDNLGNASGGLSGGFFVDTVAPGKPENASPATGGASRDRTPRLSWDPVTDRGAGLDYYLVTLDGGTPVRVDDTSFVPGKALDDGRHEWSVRAIDKAGNDSPAAGGEFTVDTRAPQARVAASSSSTGRLRVRCRTSESGRCTVKVVAGPKTAKRLHLGRRTVTLGRAKATVKKPGRTITVRLSSRARRALLRYGAARVTVRLTVTDAAGNAKRTAVTTVAR
jgi:thermitase